MTPEEQLAQMPPDEALEAIEAVRQALQARPPHQFVTDGLRAIRNAGIIAELLIQAGPKILPPEVISRIKRSDVRRVTSDVLTQRARYWSRHTGMPRGRPQGKTLRSDMLRKEIKAYVNAHPDARLYEIAEAVGRDERTVQRHLRTLKLPAITRKRDLRLR